MERNFKVYFIRQSAILELSIEDYFLEAFVVNVLKLPVEIENFEEIRKLGFYYVDKTMLIEQLLQSWGNEDNIEDSIRMLSQLLYKHYGQKVVMLIDEYDVPLDKAFQNGYYKEMVSLIRGLFGQALKTNEFLQFAVLTGCLRISQESIFTGLTALLFAGNAAW